MKLEFYDEPGSDMRPAEHADFETQGANGNWIELNDVSNAHNSKFEIYRVPGGWFIRMFGGAGLSPVFIPFPFKYIKINKESHEPGNPA